MSQACESCGMPVESGRYCVHCVDETGALQDFATRLSGMVEWRLREGGGSREQAEREAIAHMAGQPAWRDHPRVRARFS